MWVPLAEPSPLQLQGVSAEASQGSCGERQSQEAEGTRIEEPGSPLLPPRQVCRLTLPPAPQPSPPGVRERVQPGSDIEQELHSLESILPVNKKEGKKSH